MLPHISIAKQEPIISQEQPALRELVETALARSSYLTGKNLRIEVHQDDVVLRGVVRSYYQKQLAQESLRKVQGVRFIKNELEVISF